MEKQRMKLKVTILKVAERSGISTKDGKPWKMVNAAMTLFDLAGNFFGMADCRLPDTLAATKPGNYEAEISFEYATDIRAFRPRIEALAPVKA